MLTFTFNPAYLACAGNSGTPPPWGSLGPAGWSASPYPYRVGLTVGSSTGQVLSYQPLDPQAGTVVGYYSGGAGELWAGRGVAWGTMCGNTPQYLLSGSETVTAEVLAPAKVTPHRTSVVTGDTVTFTVTVPWTSNWIINGTGWVWVKDSASSPNAVVVQGCVANTSCSYRVFGDGHAEVRGIWAENAVSMTGVSPRIHVAPTRLVLVADSTHVASGSQVKFTARRADAKPVQVQSWVWKPGSASPVGPLAVDCAGGDSVCVTTLQNTTPVEAPAAQTGTMTAWAVLGTASESASVAVTVDPPRADTGGGCGSAAMKTGARTAQTASSCPPPGGTPSLDLTPNTVSLYPRIRTLRVNGITVPEHEPDTVQLQVLVTRGGNPVPAGTPVTIRAEFLPNTGGHTHVATALPFQFAALADSEPEKGKPVVGYFFTAGGQKVPDVQVTTNSNGMAETKLVAGYLGGQARVIASTYVGDSILRDTSVVSYAVPGLVSLPNWITSSVYWIGGTTEHPQWQNFYIQNSVAGALQAIAESLKTTSGGQTLYLQYNDASLPSGGAFTTAPQSAPGGIDSPFRDHRAHAVGLDIDVGLCYADTYGDGDDKEHRVSGTFNGGSVTCRQTLTNSLLAGRAVSQDRLNNMAQLFFGVNGVHPNSTSGTHYHIRFQ